MSTKVPESTKRCAYCGSSGELTREHLWPASLHARLVKANAVPQGIFWTRKMNKDIGGEPTIKDVCRTCNNGELSKLDAYICEMFDDYFIRILQRDETIRFRYDYHLLKRWLLKVCFNSARMHSSLDAFVFSPLLPYINGQSTRAGRSVQLFVQLAYPGTIPSAHLAEAEFQDGPTIWEPQDNRLGHIHFSVPKVGRKILRAVHLRSYSFLLAFWEPHEGTSAAVDFASVFQAVSPGTNLLLASRQYADLTCNGVDAWESFYGSRENAFSPGP